MLTVLGHALLWTAITADTAMTLMGECERA